MAAVLGHLLRPRGRHERIRGDEDDDGGSLPLPSAGDEGASPSPSTAAQSRGSSAAASEQVETVLSSETETEAGSPARTEVVVETVEDEETGNAAAATAGFRSPMEDQPSADVTVGSGSADPSSAALPLGQQDRLRAYLTQRRLAELEEERDLRRRRQSTCTLIVVFVLFRLWVEALAEGDVGLVFISLVGTSWTAKWIRTRREEEEEMDRAIEAYVREAGGAGGANADGAEGGRTLTAAAGGMGADGTIEAGDLRFTSFQAQLALAILESQRQMMQGGGHGHPDRAHGQNAGVSEEARGQWSRYSFRTDADKGTGKGESSSSSRSTKRGSRRCGGYGSVSATDDDENGVHLEVMEEGLAADANAPEAPGNGSSLVADSDDDADSIEKAKAGLMATDDGGSGLPSCSICLGDYENGERLVKLPCGHVYHEECVMAWVSNHVRCPLCNYDLEAGSHESEH